ncbi:hypothetical protein [uncultured Oscillibacter sp.]|uniref:hypothetical protein n=1 Tax=uncultured Oscillibacter sp. TaxID=876091 RepID=UPI0028056364|nr:hypothetical protein [uncultured Oscillibacter sp.]
MSPRERISLCRTEELEIPQRILGTMAVEDADGFWKGSKRFWRFFVARNENDLSLRVVDSLGFAELKPLGDGEGSRLWYQERLQAFLELVARGGAPESAVFDDMSELYGFTEGAAPPFTPPPTRRGCWAGGGWRRCSPAPRCGMRRCTWTCWA